MDTIVKGIDEGLLVILPEGDWSEVRHSLFDKIESQSNFFRGASAFIDVTARDMRVVEINDLRGRLDQYGVQMKGLLSISALTQKNAQTLGLLTMIPQKRGRKERQAAGQGIPRDRAFFVCKNVRSGVQIKREESIVVVGDVNPGAELISERDVIVWGRIKGKISAGAKGDEKAVIRALSLGDSQISIAGIMDVFPKRMKDSNPNLPLVLKIRNGEIIMENTKA